MPRKSLGKVIPSYAGSYDSIKSYDQTDIVFYVGGLYIAIKQSYDIAPGNEEYWRLLLDLSQFGGGPGGIETDPTVSAWAKEPVKPVYSYSEIQNTPDIPTVVSGLVNDVDFQSGEQVQTAIYDAISGLSGFTALVVETLPSTGDKGIIYFAPSESRTDNYYDEYIWVENRFELIGNTAVDLSGYVPTSRKIAGKELNADVTLGKADIGLANVDNTSDINKPLSTATQTALDGKLNLSGGTMTGALAAVNPAIGTAGVRNSTAGTTDLTAGVSALATGQVYYVYE